MTLSAMGVQIGNIPHLSIPHHSERQGGGMAIPGAGGADAVLMLDLPR